LEELPGQGEEAKEGTLTMLWLPKPELSLVAEEAAVATPARLAVKVESERS
jgi:hypothetical protein